MGPSFANTITFTKVINGPAGPPTFHIMAGKCCYEITEECTRTCCLCSYAKDAANKACSRCGHSVLEHEEASHFIRFSAPANDTIGAQGNDTLEDG
ncbi:hypothetical protein BDW59DRAFT_142415 [Aspergillus cavernicola]|uniref:Uncharacterized protein n=1 Tax=Aspergillus cavernicola TaxID=176166 RepID=A0ABR4IQU3_9EURO